MAVTQKDVADKAGVTRSVVSKVMHGGADTIRVNEETAERVARIAREMGYQPSAVARNFRLQKTGQIGLLHGDGFSIFKFDGGSLYFASLTDGIVIGAFKHKYTLGLCPDLFGPSPENAMADGRFDGFIWYSTRPSQRNEDRLKQCQAPLVLLHTRAAAFDSRFPTVICDNDQGIRLALEHLAELGHRRISFAYDGYDTFTESTIRCDAFLRHCSRLGLFPALVDITLGPDGVRGDNVGTQAYFERGPMETAMIGDNEDHAVRAMRVAKAAGLTVPEDFSVIGFDSTSFCDYQNPPLTAIYQPLPAMGELAVDLLVDLIDGKQPESIESMLPCRLDVRGSTAPPRTRPLSARS